MLSSLWEREGVCHQFSGGRWEEAEASGVSATRRKPALEKRAVISLLEKSSVLSGRGSPTGVHEACCQGNDPESKGSRSIFFPSSGYVNLYKVSPLFSWKFHWRPAIIWKEKTQRGHKYKFLKLRIHSCVIRYRARLNPSSARGSLPPYCLVFWQSFRRKLCNCCQSLPKLIRFSKYGHVLSKVAKVCWIKIDRLKKLPNYFG